MKIKIFLSILLGMLFASCVNQIDSEIDSIKEGNLPIMFTAKISPMSTRVVDNAFEVGDKVGLYATVSDYSLTENRYIDNLSLSYNSENSLTPIRDIFYPEGKYNLDIYAYYPYQATAIANNKSIIPVAIQENQESDTNFSLSNFLVAKEFDVENGSSTVLLDFQPKFSKISISIKFEDENAAKDALKSNPKVVGTNFYTEAIYDFSTDAVSDAKTPKNLTAHGDWIQDGAILYGKELLVVPQAIEQQQMIFDINGRIFTCALNDEDFSQSGQYHYDIDKEELTEGALNEIKASISDWEIIEDRDEDAKSELTSIYIQALSFSTSDIYHVFHDGMPIAEICKEYLYKKDVIDSRALVVYPIKNGIASLQEGLVLQLLDEEGEVHGGSVSWNTTTNELTYVAGTSSPIEVLYVDENKQISQSKPETSLSFSVRDYVVRDVHKGVLQKYPLVKIATQYWMKEDLQTTYYSSGQPIMEITALNGSAGFAKNADASHYFYTGEAVEEGLLIPDGWKIPSNVDWKTLKEYLDDNTDALKSGIWKKNAEDYFPGNGKSGFDIFPAGLYIELREETKLRNVGSYIAYWMTGEQPNKIHESNMVCQFSSNIHTFKSVDAKVSGKDYYQAFSVRCIKE